MTQLRYYRTCTSSGKLILSIAGLVVLSLFASVQAAGPQAGDAKASWPQWRGPLGSGVAPLADPPVTWSETNHVKWKVKIPGSGTSTPVIWGDRVFLLSAIPTGRKAEAKTPEATASGGANTKKLDELYQFVVLCLDRQTGKMLWQKTVREQAPHEGHHPDHGYASGSPATDGQLLYVFFGSRGLHCLDLEGNLKWSKDFGQMQTRNSFGEGSSPALYGDTVVINWDDETENDFIVALDKRTGKELWRTLRQEPTGWSTPLIVEFDGKAQVVVNATKNACSYDLATGKELWRCSGQTANAIPSPVASADTVYLASGFRGSALYAIALGRTGNLTGTDAIRWSHNKQTPYVPSPLLVEDSLYFTAINNGVLSCVDARTGTPHFEGERLEGINGIYASPVAAKNRVYVLGRDGTCLVLKQGPKLEVLARNKLDDKTDASLAAVGKELFVRGHQYLYCLAEK